MDAQREDGPVRRRRAERSRGRLASDAWRRAARPLLVIGVLIVIAVAVWGAAQIPKRPEGEKEKMRHWHAGFKIFVDGHELDFHRCEFDLNGCQGKEGTRYGAGHLHYDEPLRYMLHIEHAVKLGNLTIERWLHNTGFELTNTSLRLDGRVNHGELVENNATHTWQLWVSYCVQDPPQWIRLSDLTTYAPQQHDRFLLTYTDKPFSELGDEVEHIPTSAEMNNQRAGSCPRVVSTTTSSPT